MQVVDILRDDVYVEIFLEIGQEQMPGVGHNFVELAPALVVEFEDEFWVFPETFGCGYVLDVVAFPQTIGIPKGFEPAFGRDTGAGEHDEFFQGMRFLRLKFKVRECSG